MNYDCFLTVLGKLKMRIALLVYNVKETKHNIFSYSKKEKM
jgi:hypothetical protein